MSQLEQIIRTKVSGFFPEKYFLEKRKFWEKFSWAQQSRGQLDL